MIKLISVKDGEHSPDFVFYCKGCKAYHGLWTTSPNFITGEVVTFDGSTYFPTIKETITRHISRYSRNDNFEKIPKSEVNIVCEFTIKLGYLHYTLNTTHDFRGMNYRIKNVFSEKDLDEYRKRF